MQWKSRNISCAVVVVLSSCFQTATSFSTPSSSVQINNLSSSSSSSTSSSQLKIASAQNTDNEITSQSSPLTPDMEAYAAGYSTVFDELPYQISEPTSFLPSDLVGTYYKSGPAMFSAGSLLPPKKSLTQPKQPPVPDGQDQGRMVKHPFEGDGGILGITFNGNGKAVVRYRYVRTASLTRERKKGKKLYSGMESTREEGSTVGNGQGNDFPVPLYKHHLQPGLNKNRKNTSNTRAIYWSKKLLTLWEGGLPYKLDALGLSTEGRSQLGGVLNEDDPFSGKAVFDAKKDRLVSYSNKQGSGSSDLTVYEFNSKFRVASEVEYTLPGFAVLSDFAVTEKYTLFVQPPIATNGMQFMMSKDPVKALKFEQGAAMLHVLKRGTSDMKTISIPVDNLSDADLHFCNAYEDDEGKIILDVIRSDNTKISPTKATSSWPWASTIDDFEKSSSQKSLWRYTIQVSAGSVTKECLTDEQTYFGVINQAKSGQKHSYIYAASGVPGNRVTPPQGIIKVNVDTKETQSWYPEEYEFCGEPMYAPRKGDDADSAEDNGYIMSVLFNGQKKESELIVFEAANISKGPISRVPLGLAIPHGLYGCFASSEECNWDAEEIERRAKLADKMESRGNMWNEVKSDFSGLGLRLDDFEEYFGDIL